MDGRRRGRRQGRYRRFRNHPHNNLPSHDLPPGQFPLQCQPEFGFSHDPAFITRHSRHPNFAILPFNLFATGLESYQTGYTVSPVAAASADMLGAQARAAELQAAKSAAMRQRAHRDAEDHNLPPEPAPVLLTDFVRNPFLNKNKGIKAFRPLTDSDFEATNNSVDPQSSLSDSPFADNSQTGVPGSVPLAPRAMLSRSDSYASKMTPSRVRAPIFTPRLQLTDSVTKALEVQDAQMPASSYPCPTPNTAGYVYGPEDLSPTKQELKLAEMRHKYDTFHDVQTPLPYLPTPFTPDARFYNPQQSYQHNPHILHPDIHTHQPLELYAYNRPLMFHYDSETGASATGCGQAQTHIERTQMFADDLMNHQHRLQQQSRILEPTKQSLSLLDHEQPYDRNSKMQSFVLAQQAMARRGKTVLHNPDLHKSPQLTDTCTAESCSSTAPTPSPLRSQIKHSRDQHENSEEISRLRQNIRFEDKPAILRAVLRRNNGLPGQSQDVTIPYQARSVPTIANDKGVEVDHYSSEIVSDDWCMLRPITTAERTKMLRTTRRMANEPSSLTPSHSDPVPAFQSRVGVNTEKWLQEKRGGQSTRRLALEEVVDEHEKQISRGPAFGIIGKPVVREKTDLGSRGGLKAVARVMATLYDAADERRRTPSQNEFTPTPRYAIDKSAAADPSGASLFDDIGFDVQSSKTRSRS